MRNKRTWKRWLIFLSHLEIQKLTSLTLESRTFELFFDNELIDLIVQMTNAYAIEINAAGWVPIDRNDIRWFLGTLMLSGYVRLPSWKKPRRWRHQSSPQLQKSWGFMNCFSHVFWHLLNQKKLSKKEQ